MLVQTLSSEFSVKKSLALAVLTTASLFLVGCFGDKPEKVAQQFMDHLSKKEFDKATELATPESAQMINLMAMMSAGQKDTKEEKITVTDCKVTEETASCTTKGPDGKEQPGAIDMKKVDGDWKVHMAKPAAPEGAPQVEMGPIDSNTAPAAPAAPEGTSSEAAPAEATSSAAQ
jgi:hypothetical protein